MPENTIVVARQSVNQRQLDEIIARLKQTSRAATDLPRRAALCRQALEYATQEQSPLLWAQFHFELGLCLARSDVEADWAEAIAHWQQSQAVYTPDAYPYEWCDAQQNMALLYEKQTRGDHARNREQAFELHQVLTTGDRARLAQEWARSHAALGRLYFFRAGTNRAEDIEAGIGHCREALQLWQEERNVEWAAIHDLLGVLYRHRSGERPVEDLETCLQHHQTALGVLEPVREQYPEQYARVRHHLGTAWLYRVAGERNDNLEQAIRHLDVALTEWQKMSLPLDRTRTEHNLALAYAERQTGNRQENLQLAIRLLQGAADFYSSAGMTVYRAIALNSLGNAYLRFVHQERAENVERAIRCYGEALELSNWAEYEQDRPMTLHNLAVAYSERPLGERGDNLRRALDYGEMALGAVDRRALIQWAMIQTDMVDILWKLAQQAPDRRDDCLERAIAYGEQVVAALAGHPPSHRLALAHYNLGNAYSDRRRDSRVSNQEQAIAHYQRALDFYTERNLPDYWANTHNNLGASYVERIEGRPNENQEQAILHLSQVLKVLTPDNAPVDTRRAARNLGNLDFALGRWTEAVGAYRLAIESTENLYQAALLRRGKEIELAENADLYHRVAYAMLKSSADLRQEAAVALERGRARLLADALERDRVAFDALAVSQPDLHAAYCQAATRLSTLESQELYPTGAAVSYDLMEAKQTARAQLRQVVRALREQPGCGNLFALPDADEMFASVPPAAPLVYLIATPAGGAALIVGGHTISCKWLDRLTQAALMDRVARWQQAYLDYLDAYRLHRSSPTGRQETVSRAERAWFGVLETTLVWLGQAVTGDLVAELGRLGYGSATLIPAGLLALLPLHAAWHDEGRKRRYAIDEISFAYAPSARTLTRALDTTRHIAGERLFAVDNPDGTLRFATQEVDSVSRHFAHPWVVSRERATLNTALQAMSETDVYHFCCHGKNNWQDPLDSALSMALGKPLSVRDLIAHAGNRQARLVFLSACETGLVGRQLPDEAIGMPAGFLQGGAAGVISTLWGVDDEATASLVGRFYENWKEKGLSPLEALVAAQRWIRDEANGGQWAHPFYWAGFTLTGV